VDLRRLRALLVVGLLFFYGQPVTRFFWFLDLVLFPGFRRTSISEPTFIVGNFRSGTSHLQRLLANDGENFTSLTTAEIYLTPTISQRKLARGLGIIDRALGSPVRRILERVDRRILQQVPYHPVSLFGPEEDAGLLLFPWACFFLWFVFPKRGSLPALSSFDTEVPDSARNRIIGFYAQALRRHLYDRESRGLRRTRILSKNPSFTPMLESLAAYFPDSKFIYLYRDPERTLRSTLGWFGLWFSILGTNPGVESYLYPTIELMERWYYWPRTVFPFLPPTRWTLLRYERFIEAKEDSLEELYHRLEIEMGEPFRAGLRRLLEKEEHGRPTNRAPRLPLSLPAATLEQKQGYLVRELDNLRGSEPIWKAV
jgi:hypothetical protein